jgi:hypothetical protein
LLDAVFAAFVVVVDVMGYKVLIDEFPGFVFVFLDIIDQAMRAQVIQHRWFTSTACVFYRWQKPDNLSKRFDSID